MSTGTGERFECETHRTFFHVKNYQERHIRLNSHSHRALQSMLVKRHAKTDFVFHRRTEDEHSRLIQPPGQAL